METDIPLLDPLALLVGAALNRHAYASIEQHSVHCLTGPPPSAASVAKVLATPADLLWPRPEANAPSGVDSVRLLSAREIGAHRFLGGVQRRLPGELRLWVAVWPDETMAMAALPRSIKEPRGWWLTMMHDAAQIAPQLVAATERSNATQGVEYVLRNTAEAKGVRHV